MTSLVRLNGRHLLVLHTTTDVHFTTDFAFEVKDISLYFLWVIAKLPLFSGP